MRLGLRLSWRVTVHGAQRVPAVGGGDLGSEPHRDLGRAGSVGSDQAADLRPGQAGGLHRSCRSVSRLISVRFPSTAATLIRKPSGGQFKCCRAGRVLAVFPEGARSGGEVAWARRGAAYLAMVSGAPIVPVAILGTREPGQRKNQLPRLRGSIHLVYGEPFTLPRTPWPRRKAAVAEWTAVVRERLADHDSRRSGADRATLAGATEGPNPSSTPIKSLTPAHTRTRSEAT